MRHVGTGLLLFALAIAGCKSQEESPKETASAPVEDPVCGMMLAGDEVKLNSMHEGKEFGFCSEDCKKKFDGKPAPYRMGFCI